MLFQQRSVCKKGGTLRARQLRTLANQFVCGRGEGKEVGEGVVVHQGQLGEKPEVCNLPPENNVIVSYPVHYLLNGAN